MKWDELVDFFGRGGALIVPGIILLLYAVMKTSWRRTKKGKVRRSSKDKGVIAGRKEDRVIIVYARHTLHASDWKDLGLTIIDLKDKSRGSDEGTDKKVTAEEGTDNEGSDDSLVERLEMLKPLDQPEAVLTENDEEELQELMSYVEEQQNVVADTEMKEEPLDIGLIQRNRSA